MRGSVVVEEEAVFSGVAERHPTFAQTSAQKPGDVAAGKALYTVCAGCHGAQAQGILRRTRRN